MSSKGIAVAWIILVIYYLIYDFYCILWSCIIKRNLFLAIKNNRLIKDITIVATGNVGAQFINVLFSVVITKLYGPEIFGIYGTFNAFLIGFIHLSGLTMPAAIVIAKDEEVKSIEYITLAYAGLFALISLLAILIFKQPLFNVIAIDEIKYCIYLIPFAIISNAYLQILQNKQIRFKAFKDVAKSNFTFTLAINLLRTLAGVWNPNAVKLIVISSLSGVINSFIISRLIKKKKRPDKEKLHRQNLIGVAKKYKDFPLYKAPQLLINIISNSMPIILLGYFFGASAAGFYLLARTVMSMPAMVVSNAIANVLYAGLTDENNANRSLMPLLVKAIVGLSIVGAVPFGIVFFAGPALFQFVFGVEWRTAGEIAVWFAVWEFFNFIYKPCQIAQPLLNLLSYFFKFEALNICLQLIAFVIVCLNVSSPVDAIRLFAITNALAILIMTLKVVKTSHVSHSVKAACDAY